MKITNPLDNVLDNRAKVKILRFLSKTGVQWNGRQIAKEVGITPRTAHKALSRLCDEGILIMNNVGRTYLFNLNEGNYVVESLIKPLFAEEEKVFEEIVSYIKSEIKSFIAKKQIESIVLFGSVQEKRDHATSDIDLAIIIKEEKYREKIEEFFEKIDSDIMSKFGNTISIYINTKTEFADKYRKGMSIIKNILKSYKLIYGQGVEKFI